jgi:hypothetical protein
MCTRPVIDSPFDLHGIHILQSRLEIFGRIDHATWEEEVIRVSLIPRWLKYTKQ